MNTFLLILAGWIISGFLAGLLIIIEFRIKKIQLSERNIVKYFLIGCYWGYISFIWAFYNIVKTLRNK